MVENGRACCKISVGSESRIVLGFEEKWAESAVNDVARREVMSE